MRRTTTRTRTVESGGVMGFELVKHAVIADVLRSAGDVPEADRGAFWRWLGDYARGCEALADRVRALHELPSPHDRFRGILPATFDATPIVVPESLAPSGGCTVTIDLDESRMANAVAEAVESVRDALEGAVMETLTAGMKSGDVVPPADAGPLPYAHDPAAKLHAADEWVADAQRRAFFNGIKPFGTEFTPGVKPSDVPSGGDEGADEPIVVT